MDAQRGSFTAQGMGGSGPSEVSSKLSLLVLKQYDNPYINKELEKIINMNENEQEKIRYTEEQQNMMNSNSANMVGSKIGAMMGSLDLGGSANGFRDLISSSAGEGAADINSPFKMSRGRMESKVLDSMNNFQLPPRNLPRANLEFVKEFLSTDDDYENERKELYGLIDIAKTEATESTTNFFRKRDYDFKRIQQTVLKDNDDQGSQNGDINRGFDEEIENVVGKQKENKQQEKEIISKRNYDFKGLKKSVYNDILKDHDQARQAENHHFLTSLRNTVDDRRSNYGMVPKLYRMMEKVSNVKGQFMSTQDQVEPFPYLEIGDLAHKLVYYEKAMLGPDELDFIDSIPDGDEPGPVESLELAKVILGQLINKETFKSDKVENALLEKFSMHSVGLTTNTKMSSNSWLESFSDTNRLSKLNRDRKLSGGNTSTRANEEARRPAAGDKAHITFGESRTIKYYDKPQKHLEMKHFQQQVVMEGLDEQMNRRITDSDFESSYLFAKDAKQKLPPNVGPDSPVESVFIQELRNYKIIVEGLIDIIMTAAWGMVQSNVSLGCVVHRSNHVHSNIGLPTLSASEGLTR